MEELKFKIKRVLDHKDWREKFHRKLVEVMVTGGNLHEYQGRLSGEEKSFQINVPYLTSIVKLFSATIMNFVVDKVVDGVIEAYQELDNTRHDQEKELTLKSNSSKELKKCEVCGSSVKVVGHTTKHYVPHDPEKERLRELLVRWSRSQWKDFIKEDSNLLNETLEVLSQTERSG